MEWPACSPDMNPIEHVWDALGRRVAGHQPPPQTLQELERALLEEWDRIPQLVINSLIDSMPQRVSVCVLMPHSEATRGLLTVDILILSLGQVTRVIPELDHPLLTTTPTVGYEALPDLTFINGLQRQ
ncbi:transposable element Tcb2 transposase [Trichonephila clavipes]|nr:transposable element Tcb2 transposase [Trichonephila clavipes]